MSLSDFTDDDPADDAGPEDIVKHELTEWIASEPTIRVYWEKANPWGYPTFRTAGTDRPDLLIVPEDGLTVAVETKHDASGVYRAPRQLQRYWEKYTDGDETYQIGTRHATVEPDVFVLATGHAPDGRLYNTKHGDDHLQTWDSWGGSKFPRKKGWLPQVEYNATKSVVRVMWQYAAASASETGVGIGALLSSQLDGDDHARPRLLYYLDGEEHWEGLR